jgi:hypothetical protein
MAFKDLLLQLSSYPERTPQEPIEQAVRLAELLGARMSALTFEIDIHVPSNPLAVAVLDVPAMIAAEESKSASNAKDLVNAFLAAAEKHGVAAEHIIERCAPAQIPDVVVEYARLRDLTIIPVGEPADFQQPIAESVIFDSGRPVLVLPAEPPATRPTKLDALGIAWDWNDAIPRILKGEEASRPGVQGKRLETSRSTSNGSLRNGAPWRRSARSRQDLEPPERDDFRCRCRVSTARVHERAQRSTAPMGTARREADPSGGPTRQHIGTRVRRMI